MKPLVFMSTFFFLAYGRPKPPPFYHYSPPEKSNISSYAAPLGSVGPLPTIAPINTSGSNYPPYEDLPSAQIPNFTSSVNNSSVRSATVTNSSDKASASTHSSRNLPSYNRSSTNNHSQDVGVIRKHIYVNLPPPEIEVYHRRPVHVKVPAPQKHYKILFIKAPNPSVPTSRNIHLPRQEEEKTLVYVLLKNVEDQLKIDIPTAVPTQPSRPEVFFINYKTQKERFSAKSVNKHKEVSGYYGPPKSQRRSNYGNTSNTKNGSGNQVSAQKRLTPSSGPY